MVVDFNDVGIDGVFKVMEFVKVNDVVWEVMKEGKEKVKFKGNWDGMYKKKGDK